MISCMACSSWVPLLWYCHGRSKGKYKSKRTSTVLELPESLGGCPPAVLGSSHCHPITPSVSASVLCPTSSGSALITLRRFKHRCWWWSQPRAKGASYLPFFPTLLPWERQFGEFSNTPWKPFFKTLFSSWWKANWDCADMFPVGLWKGLAWWLV